MNNYYICKIIIFLFFTLTSLLFSQNIWTKLYGGNKPDDGRAVIQTYDNGYIFVCATQSYGHGLVDIWLIKTNQSGDSIWNKTYGGSKIDAAEDPNCIIETKDKYYILTGTTNSFSNNDEDFDLYLVKIDSIGNIIWEREYDTNQREEGYGIINTKDNNYLVLGSKSDFTWNGGDLWLIKINSNGEIIWDKTYGGSLYDAGACLINDFDDGFIIGGSQTVPSPPFVWLLKTDARGDSIWTKQYPLDQNNQNQRIISVHLNDVGGYSLICSIDDEVGCTYPYFIKTTSSGDTILTKSFRGYLEKCKIWISSAEITNDNGFILTGECYTFNEGFSDLILMKVDSNFNPVWVQLSQNDIWNNWLRGWAVRESKDSGYVISAWFADDAMLMKTDSAGNFIIPPYTEILSQQNKGYEFSLSQNYPNPFNSLTSIKFQLNNPSDINLSIYNALGQKLQTILDKKMTAGIHIVYFNGEHFPSGIYFYQLKNELQVVRKKMLLIK